MVEGNLAVWILLLLLCFVLIQGSTPKESMWNKYKALLLDLLPKKFERKEASGALTVTYKLGSIKETLVVKEQKENTAFTLTSEHPQFGSASATKEFKPFEIKAADLQDKLMGELRRQISESYRAKGD